MILLLSIGPIFDYLSRDSAFKPWNQSVHTHIYLFILIFESNLFIGSISHGHNVCVYLSFFRSYLSCNH